MLAVPLINGGQAADEPVVNQLSTGDFVVPAFGLHRISYIRACQEKFSKVVYDILEG